MRASPVIFGMVHFMCIMEPEGKNAAMHVQFEGIQLHKSTASGKACDRVGWGNGRCN